jgi:tricorn protease-like protein
MHEVPPFSLGGPDPYAFSPDGKEIAYTENVDDVQAISTNAEIFTLQLGDANAKPVKISTAAGGDFSPAYSPDGKYLAWRSKARAGYESDRFRLMLYDRETKQTKEVLPKFDRMVDEFAWAPDSKTIYFVSPNAGEAPIFKTGLDGEGLTVFSTTGEFGDLHPASDGKTLFATKMTVRQPGEINSLALDLKASPPVTNLVIKGQNAPSSAVDLPAGIITSEAKLSQLTHLNDALLALPYAPRFTGSPRRAPARRLSPCFAAPPTSSSGCRATSSAPRTRRGCWMSPTGCRSCPTR